MSHRQNNIVLGGVGVGVRCKDEEIERTMVFHHIFVSVPRTFGDYCIYSFADFMDFNILEITLKA